MEDISNWYRVIGLYVALHVVLFVMEWYKYKHSSWSWYGFKRDGMYDLSYILIFVDMLIVIGAVLVWAFWPIINSLTAD